VSALGPIDSQTFETALHRAGDGVAVATTDGRIVLWNQAAERMLGHTAREVVGRSCCDVFAGRDEHGNRLCHQSCHVMTLVRMQEPMQHFDMVVPTKSGGSMWLDVSIIALPGTRSNGGSAAHVNGSTNGHGSALLVHVFRDVTASKELLDVVRQRFAAPPATSGPIEGAAALTRREIEVLRLVAAGGRTKTVADALHVSPATVRNHVQNILGKLGAHNRLEAVAYANRHRLL
jgi:PAS domain S-box-containing protein